VHPERLKHPNAQRPKVPDKDHDAQIKKAWKAGWWAVKTKKGHVMCYPPNGAEPVLVPGTPGDVRSVRNYRSLFAKRGLKV
jgi:hypothetical protein